MATRVPSEDIDTEPPGVVARSPAVDVGATLGPCSAALGVHPHVAGADAVAVVTKSTDAPIATRVPSEDIDTEDPDLSPAASPTILEPICSSSGFRVLDFA